MNKHFSPIAAFFLFWMFLGLANSDLEAATLSGVVFFQGTPPDRKRVKMDYSPKCDALYKYPVHLQEVVVGKGGELADVFVYIKSGLEGKKFDVPKEAVVLDQKGCWFIPRVFGIQVNQTFEVLNSDRMIHNVNATPEFNLAMVPIRNMITTRFTEPRTMLLIKCNVHPWMRAYAGVLEHPFYSVSKEDGGFEIVNLPAGKYILEAWHEKLGTKTQEIILAEGDMKEIQFIFKGQ